MKIEFFVEDEDDYVHWQILTDVSEGHIAFEIQVTVYKSTRRNISEDVRLHEYSYENLKPDPVNFGALHKCSAINASNPFKVQL